MGRKRTHLRLSATQRAQTRHLLDSTGDVRQRERLRVALWASTGEHTLEDLAAMAGRARATIQLWLGKFRSGGINQLLQRDTPPGSSSPLASPTLQSQLRAGLRAGQWQTASQLAGWLEETQGIRRARKSVYYWLAKLRKRESRGRRRGTKARLAQTA